MDNNQEKDYLDFIIKTINDMESKEMRVEAMEQIVSKEFGKTKEELKPKLEQAIEAGKKLKLIVVKDENIILTQADILQSVQKKLNFAENQPENDNSGRRNGNSVHYVSSSDEEDDEVYDAGPVRRRNTRDKNTDVDERAARKRRRARRSRSRRSRRSRSRRRR